MPIFTGTALHDGLNSFFAVMTETRSDAMEKARRAGLSNIEAKDVADFPQKAEEEITAAPGTVFVVNRGSGTWKRAS